MDRQLNAALNNLAEIYVKLVLATGQHDADYVDAYYGPEKWMLEAKSKKQSLHEIKDKVFSLKDQLNEIKSSDSEEIFRLRHQFLLKQTGSLIARIETLNGTILSFDEEAKAYYDVEPPSYSEEYFQELVRRLEPLLPGKGPIPGRIETYRQQFIISTDNLDEVFRTAIDECRTRTKKHITLQNNESFRLEYVKNKTWSGYNWYKGNSQSLIQINTDLPIFIERAVDLAAHEGYPGHHVYNCLLEMEFAREHGWIEFTVYPLFSSQSLISEGTANFGIDVAFPGKERLAFERDILFPVAGIDKGLADDYRQVQILTSKLNYAGNEAARRYLDGKFSREEAIQWLIDYALMSPERAQQRTHFFDQYRSYVINYNFGQDLVKHYIEQHGGTAEKPEKRWEEFIKLISSPRLPSGLL